MRLAFVFLSAVILMLPSAAWHRGKLHRTDRKDCSSTHTHGNDDVLVGGPGVDFIRATAKTASLRSPVVTGWSPRRMDAWT
jgi:hypothetical protein